MTNSQYLLDERYSNKKEIIEIINLTELLYDKDKGEFRYVGESKLEIKDFPNLTEIKIDKVRESYIEFAKVTKITIANCPKLKKADINTFIDNKELEITDCPSLIFL